MARITQLAEQLASDDSDLQAEAITELEAALSAEEGNRQALEAKADATCWVSTDNEVGGPVFAVA